MLKAELLAKIEEENNGVLCTKVAQRHNISRTYFLDYVKMKKLERVSHGVYINTHSWRDELYLLQMCYKRAIFSHQTALYLLNLADREPLEFTVTVKTGYNYTSLTKKGVKTYSVKESFFELGLTTLTTPYGNTVSCYNAERTLCDIIRIRDTIDMQTLQAALKSYVLSKDKNYSLLFSYADKLHVAKILRTYLEVLL